MGPCSHPPTTCQIQDLELWASPFCTDLLVLPRRPSCACLCVCVCCMANAWSFILCTSHQSTGHAWPCDSCTWMYVLYLASSRPECMEKGGNLIGFEIVRYLSLTRLVGISFVWYSCSRWSPCSPATGHFGQAVLDHGGTVYTDSWATATVQNPTECQSVSTATTTNQSPLN